MATIEEPPWLRLVKAPVIIVNAAGETLVAANEGARRILALPSRLPLPASLVLLIGEEAVEALEASTRDKREFRIVATCRTRGGFRALCLDGIACDEGFAVTLGHPVPDERAWLESLEEVAAGLPIGLEIYDRDFRPLLCNEVSDHFFDYPDVHMDHHDDWWGLAFPDEGDRRHAFLEWHERIAEARADQGRSRSAEWKVRCADGLDRNFEFRFRFVGDLYTVVFWDVTERRRLEEEWREYACTDVLTGLCNRRHFFEQGEVMRRNTDLSHEALSLLMIDIDHFKAINDQHGHAVGDHVLRVVAERCSKALRLGDLLARIGGEEFSVLLPSTGTREAVTIAGRLNRALADYPIECGAVAVDVRISVGGATRTHEGEPLESLLDRADRALYAAKSNGRDRVEFSG
ncbi:MAG: GGDEF domain-containing protein [Zavarzinia sp.]|nr:GGDEF domain-containing protein [Zavarzinia sp.]